MPKISQEYEQQQKERILKGAAEAFADKGYRQTTIDDVAKKQELSKGAIYIYFGSKEELFAAVFESYMGRRLNLLKQAAGSEGSAIERLEKVLDQFIGLLAQHDDWWGRLWSEFYLEGPRIGSVRGLMGQLEEQLYALVYDLLATGQTSGELKANLDIASITTILLATCDGLILNSIVGARPTDPAAVRQAMWNTFYVLLKA